MSTTNILIIIAIIAFILFVAFGLLLMVSEKKRKNERLQKRLERGVK